MCCHNKEFAILIKYLTRICSSPETSHRKQKLFILRFVHRFVGNDFPLYAPFMHEIPSLLVAFSLYQQLVAREVKMFPLRWINISRFPILTDAWSGKNVFQFALVSIYITISFIVTISASRLQNKVGIYVYIFQFRNVMANLLLTGVGHTVLMHKSKIISWKDISTQFWKEFNSKQGI